MLASAAAPERSAAAGASHGEPASLLGGINRTSFIRVQLVDRNTTIFMPFVPDVDTGSSLKGSVAYLVGGPTSPPLTLFAVKQQQKHVLDDALTLTVHNTDACSLWYCCASDAFETVSVKDL